MFEKLKLPVIGLVENMSHYHCPSCGHEDYIFGKGGGSKFASSRDLELITSIPLSTAIRMRSDDGEPVALDDDQLAKPYHDLASTVHNYQ
jgi:ATP-binding protein involved in chromosome partitioning